MAVRIQLLVVRVYTLVGSPLLYCLQRAEQRLLWLKTLREHLSAQILPVTTSHSIDITPPTLQDSVIFALTSSSQSSISQPASTGFTLPSTSRVNNLLPLDSEIWTVERLQCFKRSFHVCLLPQFSGQPTDDDGMSTINLGWNCLNLKHVKF